MREDFFLGLNLKGFHKVAMTVWGDEHKDSVPVICVHGLTRNGRDFDKLAAALSQTRTVYCPDMAGRGKSDDLPEASFYEQAQYLADITALIARTGATQVDWVGTSMGGITGMLLAAKSGNPIRRLVLNDVGTVVKKESVNRLKEYLSIWKTFGSLKEAEDVLRQIHKGFGALLDEDWAHMAVHGVRKTEEGRLSFSYDPKLAEPLKTLENDVEFWPVYDAISCPTLLLRGGESDLLPAALAEEMTKRGPKAALRTFPNVGHAPSLMVQDQIEIVTEFLN